MFSHRGKGVVRIQFSLYFSSTHSRVIPCCDLYFFFSDPCLNGENCHNFSNLMVIIIWQAFVRLTESDWSNKFSLDAAGSGGALKITKDGKLYEVFKKALVLEQRKLSCSLILGIFILLPKGWK